MFHSILVPLDGTHFAESVLPAAVRLTRRAKGRLHLLLAHQPTAALVGMGEVAMPNPDLDLALQVGERNYLADKVASLGQVGEGPIDYRQVDGHPGEAICDEAARIGADLIVMATHGRSALGRLWLGSVSHHVIRHAGVPVLLIHPGRAEGALEPHRGAGILVALDLSTFAEAILGPVVDLARLHDGRVTLLHVVEPGYHVAAPGVPYPISQDPVITEVRRADATKRLEEVAERLRMQGLIVSVEVMSGPSAAAGILAALENRDFGAVAMTTHGASGMRRLFLGNVADKVIRSSGKPVLVLRPAPLPEE